MKIKPNILLIMPDQMRGDCIGLDGHPNLITPNIDTIANGCCFKRAYSTCPSCIAARRSLLLGQYPSTSGSVGFATPGYDTPTLPYFLSKAGYYSALVGRHMHQNPATGESPGYDTCILGSTYVEGDSYADMLNKEVPLLGGIRGLGVGFNGWQAKSWPLEEHLHPTNWIVRNSRELIAKHNDDQALFLTTSFYAPHPPLIPPDFYYQRYLNMNLPDRVIGDWAGPAPLKSKVDSPRVDLKEEKLHMTQAAYYGLINHIDDQLTWLIADFIGKSRNQKRPWIIVFTSDHGEMLGDHYYFRKCEPFEGSCRIPFLINSEGLGQKTNVTINSTVCLEDILPTLLDLADIPVPDQIDGISLASILRGEADSVRHWLHCEHSPCYSEEQAFQMLTDGIWKYIWRPMTGEELLFNLNNDPTELKNLAEESSAIEKLEECRNEMINRLRSRPENFVVHDKLKELPKTYPPIMKGK